HAATLRKRGADLRGRGKRGRHAGNDLVRHPRCLERFDLFLRATEQHRVAAFQSHDDVVLRGRIDETLVDEPLRRGMAAATLAHGDLLGALRERERIRVYERVVKDDVSACEQIRRAQREQVGCAGTGADEVYATHALDPVDYPGGAPRSGARKSRVARDAARWRR